MTPSLDLVHTEEVARSSRTPPRTRPVEACATGCREYRSETVSTELARRRGFQVGHSLNVIAELPRYVDDPDIVVGLRVAAVDAFYIHLRALIEFLVKPRDTRDIRRHDYVPNFELDDAVRDRLLATHTRASQYVAHFSKQRTPTADAPIFETVDASSLRALATETFGAMDAFVRNLAEARHPCADDFAVWLAEAERRRQQS